MMGVFLKWGVYSALLGIITANLVSFFIESFPDDWILLMVKLTVSTMISCGLFGILIRSYPKTEHNGFPGDSTDTYENQKHTHAFRPVRVNEKQGDKNESDNDRKMSYDVSVTFHTLHLIKSFGLGLKCFFYWHEWSRKGGTYEKIR